MSKPPVTPPGAKLPNDQRALRLKHLAIYILDKEEEDRLKARRKGNEKRATDDGIDVKRMKDKHKMAKTMSPLEIAKHYAADFEHLSDHNINVGAQFNLFGGADVVPTKQAGPDYFTPGQQAGLDGKDCKPPAGIKPESAQRWIEGWQEGQAFRVMAMDQKKQLDSVTDVPAGGAPQPDDASDRDDQTDLEEQISKQLLRVPLSDFGPTAKIEDIELADLDKAEVEAALRVEIYDGETVRVLKETAGPKGSDADDSSPAALKAAGAARAAEKVVPLKKG